MFCAKAICILLPFRAVLPAGRMHEQEIAGGAESKSCYRSAVAPIDIVKMKAIECLGIKTYRAQDFTTRRKQHAIEDRQIPGDRSWIENVHGPCPALGRVMGNPPAQVRMTAPADAGSAHARTADNSQDVIVHQSSQDARS